MERLKLSADSRAKAGSGLPGLRSKGFVPGVLYGKKREPSLLQVPARDLEKATMTDAGFNAIFELTIDGKAEGLVRIREYQAHPIKRNFTHVDFQVVDLQQKVEVEVPIRLVGKSEGVKKGGVIEQQRRTLYLKCLVTNIPEHIDIDISALEIGQNIHANDIKLPEGVEFPHGTNFTVISVVPPTKEEEATPAAAVAAAGAPVAEGAEGAVAAPAGGEAKEGKEAGKGEKK
ncbi:MAG: 50S ribosomal protein L25 [Deltaproteobacteria bacterium]|nr:50S ribosomal protein L25 [Deltaproteobacteria bacterium]